MASLLKQATSVVRNASRTRSFASSSLVRKDFVQDLYLKELKAYKPKAVAADAHVGVVKNYSAPSAPKAPSLPSDLASELAAYDAANPSTADRSHGTSQSSGEEHTGTGADAYLEFLEQDLPKPEAHH